MRIGTDIIDIRRIDNVLKKHPDFPKRILSQWEWTRYQQYPEHRQREFLAGRFAAKEAYGKALGIGIGTKLKFDAISIEPDPAGRPMIQAGPVCEGAHVSISHTENYATATVLIECDDAMIDVALTHFFERRSTHGTSE